MTSKERVLDRERKRGRAAALDLASRAADMDGTALIAEQQNIPAWREDAVYTTDHVGKPVQDGDQVYTILMPHTPAHNPGSRPADLRAIYDLRHTKDPKRAKAWMVPYGISGLYKLDECCTENGGVHRNLYDNNEFAPSVLPERWEYLGTIEEVQAQWK